LLLLVGTHFLEVFWEQSLISGDGLDGNTGVPDYGGPEEAIDLALRVHGCAAKIVEAVRSANEGG